MMKKDHHARCCYCLVTVSYLTLWDPMDFSTLGFSTTIISWSSLKFMSIELVMLLITISSFTTLSPFPSVFPSIRVFSKESALHTKWPKYRSFSFSISPSKKYSGLISFKIDWYELLAVQDTLRSLLHHYISKASILRHGAFFMIQLSHLYMTTGKMYFSFIFYGPM